MIILTELEEIQIKLHLKGKHKDWFTDLKDKYGITYNVEVVRHIIKKLHDIEFNSSV